MRGMLAMIDNTVQYSTRPHLMTKNNRRGHLNCTKVFTIRDSKKWCLVKLVGGGQLNTYS